MNGIASAHSDQSTAKSLHDGGPGCHHPTAPLISQLTHMPWCDLDQHDDGGASTDPYPSEQVCFSELDLEFHTGQPADRCSHARLSLVHMHPHPDDSDRESETTLTVAVDAWDGFLVREGQIESIAYGMLERLAVLRGQDESAARWRRMAIKAAGGR